MPEPVKAAGTVLRVLGNNNYEVEMLVDEKPVKILCYLSGKMCKQFKVSVLAGDIVQVVVSPPFDRGRIVWREKG